MVLAGRKLWSKSSNVSETYELNEVESDSRRNNIWKRNQVNAEQGDMLKRLIGVGLVTVILGLSVAEAEPRRLSQIDFDRPSAELRIPVLSDSNPSRASRARLDDPEALKAPQGLLIPMLKGVQTDVKNDSAITSSSSWAAQTGTYCELMKGDTEECNSARALRDVLRRFTGGDEFFNSQCQATCRSASDIAVLKDLTFDAGPTKLRKVLSGNSSYIQITKPLSSPWKVGQVIRPDCTCVPKSCLDE